MSLVLQGNRRSNKAETRVRSAKSTAGTEEFVEWLRPLTWDHFVTLTFKFETSAEEAARQFECRYVRHLESLVKQGVNYFGSVEAGSVTERNHIHAVLAGTSALSCKVIAAAWQRGLADVRLFDPKRGGLSYVTKSRGEFDSRLLIHDRRLMAG